MTMRLPLLLLLLLPVCLPTEMFASTALPPLTVTTTLLEGAPVGTNVISLARSLGTELQKQANMFKFVNNIDNKLFRLDSQTGLLTTQTIIDRMAIASASNGQCDSPCKYYLLVHVSFIDRPEYILTVIIELQEQNNHAPEFTVFRDTVEISELAEVNKTTVGVSIEVQDRDSPRFGLRELRIAPADLDEQADGVFDIHPRTISEQDAGGPVRIRLLLLKPLDRETRSSYRLVLSAIDGGLPPKTGTQTLSVIVKDENDHQPQWVTTDFNFSVSEAAPEGYLVVQLRAEDADSGPNGRVVYQFCENLRQRQEIQSFELDSGTGELRVRRGARLDYEGKPLYRLCVAARDQGVVPKQTEAMVIVRLLDENDETPQISVSNGEGNSLSVKENEILGKPIGYVIAKDKDSGDNSRVTCELATRNSDLAINLQKAMKGNSVYQLVTAKELDWESQKVVTDTIICTDSGRPAKTASHLLRVTVIDENDSPPNFTHSVYKIAFDEEQEPGTKIQHVTAVDPDQNPQLVYSLDSVGDEIATIDKTSGALHSKQRFDRETRETYRFEVRVTDGRFRDNASVELTIRDVNDHWPEWSGRNELSVMENSPAGTLVGTIAATDADAGENGRVGFYILPPSVHFEIRPDGSIYTRSSRLDREQTPHLEINVTAHDLGRPRKSRWERVHIRLLDANDNSPSFVFPGVGENRVNVSCREPPNAVVARVSATDPDESENGRVTYNLTDDGVQAGFAIDPHTGDLLLTGPPDCDPAALGEQLVTLKVRAMDNGIPARSSVKVLLVAKLDRAPVRPRLPGRGAGGDIQGGSNPGLGGDDSGPSGSLTAVIGLMVATGVLILVLVFAICLLRRKSSSGSGAAGAAVMRQIPGGVGSKSGADKRRLAAQDISLPQQIGVDQSLLLKSSHMRASLDHSPPPGYSYPEQHAKRSELQSPQQQLRQHHHHHQELAMHQLLYPANQRSTAMTLQAPAAVGKTLASSSYQTIRPRLSSTGEGPCGAGDDPMNGYSRLPVCSDSVGDTQQQMSAMIGIKTVARRQSEGTHLVAKQPTTSTMDIKQLKPPYTTVSFV